MGSFSAFTDSPASCLTYVSMLAGEVWDVKRVIKTPVHDLFADEYVSGR